MIPLTKLASIDVELVRVPLRSPLIDLYAHAKLICLNNFVLSTKEKKSVLISQFCCNDYTKFFCNLTNYIAARAKPAAAQQTPLRFTDLVSKSPVSFPDFTMPLR